MFVHGPRDSNVSSIQMSGDIFDLPRPRFFTALLRSPPRHQSIILFQKKDTRAFDNARIWHMLQASILSRVGRSASMGWYTITR